MRLVVRRAITCLSLEENEFRVIILVDPSYPNLIPKKIRDYGIYGIYAESPVVVTN